MSFKNTPITAKIKRTTKGGITQPLLNVGAPIKMKMSSPAKKKYDGQSVKPGEDGLGTKTAAGDKSTDSMRAISSKAAKDFKNEMSRQDKVKADNLAASKAKKAAKDKSNYQKSVDQYRKDVSTLNANTKSASKNVNPKQMSSAMNRSVRQAGRIKAFEKNLYDYDTKNKAGSTEGYTAKEYAMAKASGTYKSRAKKKDTAKTDTAKTNTTKNKKVSYDTAYKNRDKKTYGKMDKATYIKEAKRQNASKKAGKGWDVKNKVKDTPPRKKAVASTTKPVGIKKVEISTKLDPKALKSQAAKVNARTEPKKEVKKTRAQKLRSRGEKALATGDKKKALRIKRRYDKQVAKDSKKKGQSAGAIEVKKKNKKPSFNTVTNRGGYEAFKKAGGLSAWSKGEIEVK